MGNFSGIEKKVGFEVIYSLNINVKHLYFGNGY